MDASGEPCLMISPPIKRCTTIFVDGSKQVCGNKSINRWCKQVRVCEGRNEEPTLAIIDSRSVKGTSKGVTQSGVDGFKRVKGLKWHLMVDVLGLILGIFISAANESDSKMAPNVLVPVLDEHQKIEGHFSRPKLSGRTG